MAKAWTELRRRVAKNGTAAEGLEESLRLRLRTPPQTESLRRRAPRLVRQPLAFAGVLLVLVALVGYLAAYRHASERTAVLVAARDLPAGSTIRSADLRVSEIAASKETVAALVPATELRDVVGSTVPAALAAGAPLARAALAGVRQPAAFTLVVPALHALGGTLQPGDRITVLATFETQAGAVRTRPLARHLRVLAAGRPPAGLDSATAAIPITVALPDPATASLLALANQAGKIDLLRDSPAQEAAPIPAVSEAGR